MKPTCEECGIALETVAERDNDRCEEHMPRGDTDRETCLNATRSDRSADCAAMNRDGRIFRGDY